MRGYSLSGGRPVVSLDLSYDDASGIYVAASGSSVATAHDGVQALGLQETIGYARRLKSATLDLGVVNSGYTRHWSGGRSTHYVEGYFGIVTKDWSSHLFYSPDYYRTGAATLYGEIDGVIRLRTPWRLNGHIGKLWRLDGAPPSGPRSHTDWRVGVSTRIAGVELQIAQTGGGPQSDYYQGRSRGRTASVFMISTAF